MCSPPEVIRFWGIRDFIRRQPKPYSIYLTGTIRTETLAVLARPNNHLSTPDNSFCKAGCPSPQRFVDSLHMKGETNHALRLGTRNLVPQILFAALTGRPENDHSFGNLMSKTIPRGIKHRRHVQRAFPIEREG